MLPEVSAPVPVPAVAAATPAPPTRGRAIVEVVLCSGYPTQLVIGAVLALAGLRPFSEGRLSAAFVFTNLALDSVLLLGLVWLFLRRSGEEPRQLFLGSRQPSIELRVGLLTIPAMLLIVAAVQLGVRAVAPFLHNVPESPFEALLTSRWLVAAFVALLVIAGGIREELQRAFLLHRFEQRLGGPWIGLAVTSVSFGLGHTLQGWDAALATGTLGAFWGAIYLARRSAVSTITSHAGFNIIQVLATYATLTR